jgi:hypothetical protein
LLVSFCQQKKNKSGWGRLITGIPWNYSHLWIASLDELSSEVKQKPAKVRLRILGEVARVPGVTPVAVTAVSIHLTLNTGNDGDDGKTFIFKRITSLGPFLIQALKIKQFIVKILLWEKLIYFISRSSLIFNVVFGPEVHRR